MDVSWTQKKKTNFPLFVNISMTFPVILTQGKGSEDAKLKGFLSQGMFAASPDSALQEHSQFVFNWIFTPQLYSRMGPAPSQVTQRAGNSSRTLLWVELSAVMLFGGLQWEWLQQRSFHCHGGAGTGLHWIPGVHPWEGMDDLVGSCPAFNAGPRGWVSLLVWGLCSGSHPSNKGTAVLLTQLQLQGSDYREQACRNPRPSAHVAA